ncbi:helix-turn-helix domain-containing protein [Apilactobacillus apisilvae]|uniref:Helix-turn-helix domain-containing protein n=1 Tax=Apilactobacillus apisilvae TaxID=2923364 RepID=A0ABY4PG16_9LACO|nr:helix-turn-helix transcriptional regulator [Apilactobacillus apisilvae]UQS84580.1 helix-turn-helix domain-containing protein [Apilactobacillus apisilvae]
MRFGERLKAARNKKSLTQDNAAIVFKVSRKTISSWENENSYPDINSLIKISNFYHISLDTLLKEDVGMKEFLDKNDVKKGLKPLQNCIIFLGIIIFTAYILIISQNIKLNLFGHMLLIMFSGLLVGSFIGVQSSFIKLEKHLGLYKTTWFEQIFTNIKYTIVTEIVIGFILTINILIYIFSSYDTTPIIQFLLVLAIAIIIIFYDIKIVKKNKK